MSKAPDSDAARTTKRFNSFAIRCFRDTADGDYISARTAIRNKLYYPFLWSAAQAIEKYLKCILVLNEASSKNLGHNLGRCIRRVERETAITISLSPRESALIDKLKDLDGDRYLTKSYTGEDQDLVALDLLTWRLRQLCSPLGFDPASGEYRADLWLSDATRILGLTIGKANDGLVEGGFVEKILADNKHPARKNLVWRNPGYHSSRRKRIPVSRGYHAVNSPLFNYFEDEELMRRIESVIYIPGSKKESSCGCRDSE